MGGSARYSRSSSRVAAVLRLGVVLVVEVDDDEETRRSLTHDVRMLPLVTSCGSFLEVLLSISKVIAAMHRHSQRRADLKRCRQRFAKSVSPRARLPFSHRIVNLRWEKHSS